MLEMICTKKIKLMKCFFTIYLSILVYGSIGQTDSTNKTITLSEVVFSVNKTEENKNNIAQQISVIDSKEIKLINTTTTGDLLANVGSVALQKSQQGGGSPIIRGFEASRVVLMIDGVRMNNLIYRAGHLQNIVTIDQSILERAEILYGPSSTVYGSDALGGVIHLYTKDPKLKSTTANSYLRMRPGQELTGSGMLNIGGKKWASLSSATISDFSDLRMGAKINPAFGKPFGLRNQYLFTNQSTKIDELVNNPNTLIQKQSGYLQLDFLQKILYKPNPTDSHMLNIQYSTSSDVPRYDRLTDPQNKDGSGLRWAEWYYGPQNRLLTAYDFRKNIGAKGLHFGASYQAIQESRHDRPFNSFFLRNRIENVKVLGLSSDVFQNKSNYEVRYGIDFQYNYLVSTANQTAIGGADLRSLNTRYPSGQNNMLNMALYTTESWILSSKIRIVDGFRLGYVALNSQFKDKTFFPFPYDNANQKNIIYSGNVGVIYSPDYSLKISGMLSTGFRVPNIDDLSKVFDSSKGTLIVPNPNLKPEKTINYELGVTKSFASKIRWENVIYSTLFKDAIVTDFFTLNGQSSIIYDGVSSKILANQNKRKANIWGYSSTMNADLNNHFSAAASYNYTKGRIQAEGTNEKMPLDHIPPVFGRICLRYVKSNINLETFLLFNGWKHIEDYLLNGEDNEQYATSKGMPSWKTLNARASYTFNDKWSLLLGIDNVFDLQYRTFASGINAPGRNVFVTLRGGLGK
jgi:hemoglobin/transferrin/lactoferrin receptor protein